MNTRLEKQSDAAAALGMSRAAFYNLQADEKMGYPKPIYIRGQKYFDIDERIAWIKKQKENSRKVA